MEKYQKVIFFSFLLLSIISLSCAIFEFKEYAEIPYEIDGEINNIVKQSSTSYEEAINEMLNIPVDITSELAAELGEEDLPPDELEMRLNASIMENPTIFGVGVAYEPGMYGHLDRLGNRSNADFPGLYSPTYSRRNGEPELFQVSYDYTRPRVSESDPHTEWYLRAMAEGDGWNEPYFGTRSNTYLLEYSTPIERNGTRLGVVYSSYSKEGLREVFGDLNFTSTGYFFVVSKGGRVLYHPVPEHFNKDINSLTEDQGTELLESRLKLMEIWSRTETSGNNSFRAGSGQFFYRILKNEFDKNSDESGVSGEKSLLHHLCYYSTGLSYQLINEPPEGEDWAPTFFIFSDEFTSQDSLVISKDISSQKKMVMVFPIQEILDRYEERQQGLDIRFTMFLLSFFLFSFLGLIACFRYDSHGLWIASLITMILFSAGIGYVWYLHSDGVSNGDLPDDVIIYDREGLESLLEENENPNAYRVPVGIFLKSIEFSSANNVIVTGYLWQRNSVSTEELFSGEEPVIFPEAKESSFEKIYSGEDVTGWEFETVLRQQFDYSSYPFDGEDVWIRLWPNTFYRNVVLIPDLDAYSTLDPADKPGLEESIPIEGWKIQKSYFSYRFEDYGTNFGIRDYRGFENYDSNNFSELYFNVEMRRELMSPIVSNLLPVLVVAVLLFVVLLITTKNEEKHLFGFSSSGVLAYCASLFFTLIVSHASIRSKIPTEGTIYIEEFYFVMYFAILAISLNSIAFASRVDIPFIDAKDNLYVKVLYWPVIMGVLLLLTLLNFY